MSRLESPQIDIPEKLSLLLSVVISKLHNYGNCEDVYEDGNLWEDLCTWCLRTVQVAEVVQNAKQVIIFTGTDKRNSERIRIRCHHT